MALPPTWALVVADAVRYGTLRPWQPRLSLEATTEPLERRVRRLRTAWDASRLSDGKRAADFNVSILETAYHRSSLERLPTNAVLEALLELGVELALQNDNVFDFPDIDLTRSLSTIEAHHITDRLVEIQTRLDHDERIHALFSEGLCSLLAALMDGLPAVAFQDDAKGLTVPLYALLDPGTLVGQLLNAFLNELGPTTPDAIAALPFLKTRQRLWENLLHVSRLSPQQANDAPHKLVAPADSDLTPPQMIATYFGGTPLAAFAATSLPFAIPAETRFEHTAIYGGSGAGKTQTLQHLILDDLLSPDPPAMVIIDSQNQMLRKLERLQLFGADQPLADRLIIIDPEDEIAPALNMFQLPTQRLSTYSMINREMLEGQIVDLFNYIFAATAQEFTAKQGTAFAYIVRAILAHPGATIETLLRMMEGEASEFAGTIAKLDPLTQSYFANQFYQKSNNPTRQQVARRLYGLLRIPAFRRMFSASSNKLDMFDALQSGKIVLINTSLKTLGDASAVFGRYIVALTLAAAIERTEIYGSQRPAYLYLDEASEYFDEKTERILIQARKSNLGLVYATQFLGQMHHSLRQAAAANTSIKLASAVSHHDARELAPDMRTSSEFIMAMSKTAHAANWACYVRGLTGSAIQLSVPFGSLEQQPRMSDDQYSVIRARNRSRYGEAWHDKPAHVQTGFADEPDSFEDKY